MARVPRRFERLALGYLEGTLSDRARRWVERQLQTSEACRHEVAAYERLREIVARLPVEYPSAYAVHEFLPRLHERIREEEANHAGDWRAVAWDAAVGGFGGAVSGAMCAVAFVLLALSMGLIPRPIPMLAVRSSVSAAEPASVSETSETSADGGALMALPSASDATAVGIVPGRNESGDVDEEIAAAPKDTPDYDRLLDSQLSPLDLYGEEPDYLLSIRTTR